MDMKTVTTEDLIATITNIFDPGHGVLPAVIREYVRRTGRNDWQQYNPVLAYRMRLADEAQARAEESHS